ncbi:MAG: mannose-1-phosphate guanylyltransferase/mannose-6-phosphate isomerase [Alphaproteobacteria bacterium]
MPMSDLIPVILCGGSGTRLWPLSRPSHPKQFHVLAGSHSLLQQTVLRAGRVTGAPPLIVTSAAHSALVTAQLEAIGVAPECIIVEPCARNTAPAIALAAEYLNAVRPGALMWVLPSDHMIGDVAALAVAAKAASASARAGYLATYGIRPTEAHTGYGYIRSGDGVDGLAGVASVAAFLEKPDRQRAERFVADGGYYWNSGMFVFSAAGILDEMARYAPEVHGPVAAAWAARTLDNGILSPGADAFASAGSISIDYAVMERTDRAVVAPLDANWSDIGSWGTIWELQEKDGDGNALLGRTFALDSRRCYVRTEKPVALIGVEDLIVVETGDAILICRRDLAEQVKQAALAMGLAEATAPETAQSGARADEGRAGRTASAA